MVYFYIKLILIFNFKVLKMFIILVTENLIYSAVQFAMKISTERKTPLVAFAKLATLMMDKMNYV